jgi:ADP-ribosylglycohydrolase
MRLDGDGGIKAHYGEEGIQTPPIPSLYTDDTEMTLALLEGVLSAGVEADDDTLMTAIGRRFVAWAREVSHDRAPGMTCLSGIERYASGIDWRESGILHSKGCGSAMRVAPLGYLYQHDEARLRHVTAQTSIITHRHPTAIAASVAAAYLVKLALDGVPAEQFLGRVLAFIEDLDDDCYRTFLRVGHVLSWGSEERALKHIGEGWVGDEAVALALYCVLKFPDSYANAVRRGANMDGDSDSVASIAGGIMGARLGWNGLPPDWVVHCENAPVLETLARRMEEAKDARKN